MEENVLIQQTVKVINARDAQRYILVQTLMVNHARKMMSVAHIIAFLVNANNKKVYKKFKLSGSTVLLG